MLNLPGPLHRIAHKRFVRRLLATPEGRSHVLSQIAQAESNGEVALFDHILSQVKDPKLRTMVSRHRDDELEHEALFVGLARKQGVPVLPLPPSLNLIERLDRKLNGLFKGELTTDLQVMQAYCLLQVIEERATSEFTFFQAVFGEHDPDAGEVFTKIARDEARHLKYCHAITRRYQPSDAVREQTLAELRAIEADAYAKNERANLIYLMSRPYFSPPFGLRWLWKVLRWLGKEPRLRRLQATA
jgi:hypothetical protein